ncbi:creatininase family protein [bacterium]|nr:creatininase family protein [bacterium]MBU1919373.1 creatininase family protein [bacterium]
MSAQAKQDELAKLLVIDSLEVGPVRLEPKRVITRYTVIKGKKRESFDFIYSYEEAVFDSHDPGAVNLAAMMGAQVALNYGLFCKEIRFLDAFDKTDRAFLLEAAANTAREIYVKKFLEPNPFLRGAAAKLPVIKKRNYLASDLTFPNSSDRFENQLPAWETHRARHAISSSGGKDSLLTYGLLHEMNREVHPIYINESGRHWFTALNAYRHFAKHVPQTARVWTNSDRLFAWMLRHLPFIRQDFSDIRSDDYPIRLWTVAVFLFGTLPLLRKRGIGRLLVGDEYDTTERRSFQGIPHYDGLFDQSRYFDEMMTRYYNRKGWNISQFSILRPCSEFSIQTMLTKRYPELWKHQVSCHAAHKSGERVLPCGKCEKCRRIVAMLTAIDADPAVCGYQKKQLAGCLRSFAEKGIHQESAGAQHIAHLLAEAGKISLQSSAVKPKAHPELIQLRFEKERSPLAGIPGDLRAPLYRILLEHADGAMLKSGRLWMEIDPLTHADALAPYKYEAPRGKRSDNVLSSKFILGELTWQEAKERFRQTDIALLPVGAVEQHGPHLPLDTDAYDADYLARAVAAACSEPRPLVLPLIPYGVSYAHEDFSGTLSVGPDTLSRMVYEIGIGAAKHGITKLLIINAHGGNSPALHFAAQLINRDGHIFTCVDTGETSDADIEAMSGVHNDVHAGDIETSTSLATRPNLVKMDRAKKFIPNFSSQYLNFSEKRSIGWYARTEKITPSGVFGDPTVATREKGEKMWEIMIQRLVELVESLKGMTLDDIYTTKL